LIANGGNDGGPAIRRMMEIDNYIGDMALLIHSQAEACGK